MEGKNGSYINKLPSNEWSSSLNYYERYCGDYQRDTAHLSLAEHGAYTMLLDAYFSVEKPLPKDLSSLYRVCRAMTRFEQQAVKAVAEQFFPVSEVDGLRHNQRADREIAKARPKIEAARINGRKGGRPPKVALQRAHALNGIPDGLVTGSASVNPEISPAKPGGQTYQHQLQHQLQHQRYKNTEQGCASSPTSDSMSPLLPDTPPNNPSESIEAETAVSVPPGVAGACCKTLNQLGIQGCNPHHPTFLALLQSGAVEDEFMQAARNAVARGKASFAYVIGTVKRQRQEAAKLILHHGRMPNRQELLESSNAAAVDGWLPPELREQRAEPEPMGGQHANG